jgi:ABC-type lipoprotein release transport system permease subunit
VGLVFKIAWRNLFRHRGQSLVIGTILFLGALLMTIGNGVVTGMDRGLRDTVVKGFTGDLVLVPDAQEQDNVFLEMMGRAVRPLYGFEKVESILKAVPEVDRYLPVGKNMAMVLNEDDGQPIFLYLLGVDFARYAEMFPATLALKAGRMPRSGRLGLLLPTGARKEIHDHTNVWIVPAEARPQGHAGGAPDGGAPDGGAPGGDSLLKAPPDAILRSSMVLLGFNQDNSTTDIRLDVDGIFRFRSLNTIFGSFALVDIESYRQCLGYFLASERTQGRMDPRDSALFALGESGLDAQFGAEEPAGAGIPSGAGTPAGAQAPAEAEASTAGPARGSGIADPFSGKPRSPEGGPVTDLDRAAYNLVLVLLKTGADAAKVQEDLNKRFQREKAGVRAVGWKESLGPVGSMANLIKGALFLFTSFLFVVAVIIIINTLTMAALERTPEIGMMRAIGARKGFVSLMFLAETLVLSLCFGGLGILAGAAAVEIVSLFRITSDNDVLQLFYGGDTFRPVLSGSDFLLALGQLALVALAAVIYPLRMARRVTPLDAVYRE